ncbi:hypothetical protein BpHYR1_047585 [Brachionus plicatilis]|uniref:Uncharacterized protein n=1 Tax=Brachionus plicatilis TaxID=10195 RepID=A0A3M7SQC3_BRAPC|nr:hypothetical protein BpHYR1_047585 [Brachionus plicatilis]
MGCLVKGIFFLYFFLYFYDETLAKYHGIAIGFPSVLLTFAYLNKKLELKKYFKIWYKLIKNLWSVWELIVPGMTKQTHRIYGTPDSTS